MYTNNCYLSDHHFGNHYRYWFGFGSFKGIQWNFAIQQDFGRLEAIAYSDRGHNIIKFHIDIEAKTRHDWFVVIIDELENRIKNVENNCMKKCGA